MFDQTTRSYKDLPIRMADFGVLHRNELSGALSGLTRVRRFQQDDANILCMPEQIKAEMAGCLDFLKYFYSVLGFTYQLRLSGEVPGGDRGVEHGRAGAQGVSRRSRPPVEAERGGRSLLRPQDRHHAATSEV